jgi:hypothetical protein
MPRGQQTTKRQEPKTILRFPDLEHSKNSVVNSLAATSSQESYGHAIDEFIEWYCSEARVGFQSNCGAPISVLAPELRFRTQSRLATGYRLYPMVRRKARRVPVSSAVSIPLGGDPSITPITPRPCSLSATTTCTGLAVAQ